MRKTHGLRVPEHFRCAQRLQCVPLGCAAAATAIETSGIHGSLLKQVPGSLTRPKSWSLHVKQELRPDVHRGNLPHLQSLLAYLSICCRL